MACGNGRGVGTRCDGTFIAGSSPIQRKRCSLYVEMQRIVHDEGGAVIPPFMSYTHAASTKIHLPGEMASNWELDGHKAAKRWWFA